MTRPASPRTQTSYILGGQLWHQVLLRTTTRGIKSADREKNLFILVPRDISLSSVLFTTTQYWRVVTKCPRYWYKFDHQKPKNRTFLVSSGMVLYPSLFLYNYHVFAGEIDFLFVPYPFFLALEK